MTDRPRILALFGSAVLFGQERGNMEALAALKEEGCEVLCLVRDDAWNVSIPQALQARGLSCVRVPYIEHRLPGRMRYVVFRNPIAFLRANWLLLRTARDFRPTHIHAFNQLYVLNFALALAVLRVPMVFRAGDEPTVHNWIWRATWRFVLWQTDRFVANSRYVERSLLDHGARAEKVAVIYNAPPRRVNSLPSPSVVERDGVVRITYVGQVSEHKGVHVLVQAFRGLAAEYPNAQLVIAGRVSEWRGDAWARGQRDTTLADPLLHDRVSFVGEIGDVPGLLEQTDVHVAPSLFDDPSPNVVMEAKQAACPSIVFPKGGMPELVENGSDGLVCPSATCASLSEALRYYLSDPGRARDHGRAARVSLKKLGIEHFSTRWRETYGNRSPQSTQVVETATRVDRNE